MDKSRRFAIIVAVLVCGLSASEASAWYAPHLGRFLTRDPAGEISRGRVSTTISSFVATGFVLRDRFDPMANYGDGMNLYEYVQGKPIIYVDPSGLNREVVSGGIHQFIRLKCGGKCMQLHFAMFPVPIDECGKLAVPTSQYQLIPCPPGGGMGEGPISESIISTPAEDEKLCDLWRNKHFPPYTLIPFNCLTSTECFKKYGIGPPKKPIVSYPPVIGIPW